MIKKKWVVGLRAVIVIGVLAAVGVVEQDKLHQAFSPVAKSKVTVTVQSDDGKVSSAQVKQVQDLIEKEQLRESVEAKFGFQFHAPVTIHLAPDEEHYATLFAEYNAKALKEEASDPYGTQRLINILAKTTTGEDIGNDLFLDMGKLDSKPMLRGIVMGELTKVMLIQNNVMVPNWFREGLATHVLYEQAYKDDTKSLEVFKKQCMTSIVKSKQEGKDLQLKSSGSRLITDEYDFHALNWLATEEVLQRQGADKVKQFMQDSLSKSQVVNPFNKEFGEDEALFKINYLAKLDEEAKKKTSM